MSIRHLDSLFDPRSVAVIGASQRPASVGATVWRNLREGGFAGARWAVNPKYTALATNPFTPTSTACPRHPSWPSSAPRRPPWRA